MFTPAVLLLCGALVSCLSSAAAQGEPCIFDAAGTAGDCRSIGRCPALIWAARAARPGTPELARLRQLVSRCPRAAGRLQICCQNELTRTVTAPPPVALPPLEECGFSLDGGRVIGGVNVSIGEMPWMASIQYSAAPGRPLEHGCGGTLITARHVLTAAHCVTFLATPQTPELAPRAVVLGEVDFSGAPDCLLGSDVCSDAPLTVPIEAIFAHPDFQSVTELALPNDIAVLRLARAVPFTSFVRPVCLLTDLSVLRGHTDVSPSRFDSVVAGWGRTQVGSVEKFTPVLQKAKVPVRELSVCEAEFKAERLGLRGRICAGAGGTDTCRGDSGGPLLLPTKGGVRWYQTGVSSFGTERCGQVAGYTRVLNYIDWIVEQINRT